MCDSRQQDNPGQRPARVTPSRVIIITESRPAPKIFGTVLARSLGLESGPSEHHHTGTGECGHEVSSPVTSNVSLPQPTAQQPLV